jgi:hypothetical protein
MTHLSCTNFSSSPHNVLARLLHACGPELLPPPTVQLTPPRPRPRPHRGHPPPMDARPWLRGARLAKSRRRMLASLDLQNLDPLLGGCGSPADASRDSRHDAIASPTHPWDGGIGGEIVRRVWPAPPDSGMGFDSETMPNTSYISCYFNGPILFLAQESLKL